MHVVQGYFLPIRLTSWFELFSNMVLWQFIAFKWV